LNLIPIMSIQPLVIWCDSRSEEPVMDELLAGAAPHRIHLSGRAGPEPAAPPEAGLDQADIAFGQPPPDAAMRCENLRWIHITSAGYTRYDNERFRDAMQRRGCAFTNSSSVYDEPCAQHLLAMMLADARQLPEAFANQVTGRGWSSRTRRRPYLLNGQNVLLLGFGAIARRLVELLAPFDMKITAFRRSPTGDEPCPAIHTTAELECQLELADHVVNTLPANPATRQFVSARHVALMKPSAVFYNVGRGATVDQPALLEALTSRRIAAAYLDVTDPEPLPADHPLWQAPDCRITPHIAGSHAGQQQRAVHHFLANLRRFERGEPLLDRVF
jgi:phosphoglycerate dehydrogenase-like enzyme